VVYGLRSTELPRLSAASRPLYAAPGSFGAGSIHGFVLGEWVELHGPKAYLHMLESVAELVENGQLSLDAEADLLPCGPTPTAATADTETTTAKLPARFNATPLDAQKNGGAVVSSLEPQPVLTGDEMVQRGLIPSFQDVAAATKADGGATGMVAEHLAIGVLNAVRGDVAHEVQEIGVWAERRKVVLSFGTAEEAADEAVVLGRAVTELAQTLEWHGTKPYRPGEGPPPEPASEPEGEPKSKPDSNDEDEVEEVASLAANERVRRVDALLESNSSSNQSDQGESESTESKSAATEPETEPEPEPEPASVAGKLLSQTLRRLQLLDKYGEMLLSDPAVSENVMAAQGNVDRDALRQVLKAHGVKKLGHREKLVAALYVEPTSVNAAAEAPTRMGEINIS
jgi:hypothetical protein